MLLSIFILRENQEGRERIFKPIREIKNEREIEIESEEWLSGQQKQENSDK
jgi:hypothetical protein